MTMLADMTRAPAPLTLPETQALTRAVTRLSVGVTAVLSAVKAWAWFAHGSVAMLASFADSALDLTAALATFVAVRYAAAPPDAEHRFGHGKAEAFASLLQAGLVFASGALVGREAVARALHPAPSRGGAVDLAVMALSITLTAGLVFAQSRVLARARSVAVTGDRAHYLADLASNLAAAFGIAASSLTGAPGLDALAGAVVALWLVWGAVGVFRGASTELLDRELDETSRRRIAELMTLDPAVKDVHQLRTRASGPYIHIQMHADLDPALTLDEAHRIMVAAEKRVLEAFPSADILIHPDPGALAEPHGGAFPEVRAPPKAGRAR